MITPNGGEILSYGEVYPITWQSSSDMEMVDIYIGSRYTCAGCSPYWDLEWSIHFIPNTGSYNWSVYVDDPTSKEFIVLVQGEHFNGTSYSPLAWDESDNPFTVALSDIPTITPTPTGIPTNTRTATPTTPPTMTPTLDNAGTLFEPYINYPVGSGSATGISDFNSDGLLDVALTTSNQLLIFLQSSDGTLAGPVAYSAGARPDPLLWVI